MSALKALRTQMFKSMPEEERADFIKRVEEYTSYNFGEVQENRVSEDFNGGFTAVVVYWEEL